MAGVDTVIRVVAGTLALFVIAFVTGVGFMLLDPIYANVIDPDLMESLGWGSPQNVVMLFAALAFIGLSMVVIIWWIASPARQDVRQTQGPPF